MIEMSDPVDPHAVKAAWDAQPVQCHCIHPSSLHGAAEQIDRIREMLGLQGSEEDVPEALGKYLLHLERLATASPQTGRGKGRDDAS